MAKNKIIVIEDEPDYQEGWVEFIPELDVEIINDPDEFFDSYPFGSSLENVEYIILDFKFDTYNAEDKEILSYIRQDLKYRGKIAIWSLEDDLPTEVFNHCDAVLPKKLLTLKELKLCFTKNT